MALRLRDNLLINQTEENIMESLILLFIMFMIVLECFWCQSSDRDAEDAMYNELKLHDNNARKCNHKKYRK